MREDCSYRCISQPRISLRIFKQPWSAIQLFSTECRNLRQASCPCTVLSIGSFWLRVCNTCTEYALSWVVSKSNWHWSRANCTAFLALSFLTRRASAGSSATKAHSSQQRPEAAIGILYASCKESIFNAVKLGGTESYLEPAGSHLTQNHLQPLYEIKGSISKPF